MSNVGTTTFVEDGTRNYFTLQNEQYIRRFNWKASSIFDVGILCSVQANTNMTGGLWLGLGSSGNGNNIGLKNGGAAIQRMVGVGYGIIPSLFGYGSSYNYWTVNSDVSGSYYSGVGVWRGSFSGGSLQNQLLNGTAVYFPTSDSPARKAVSIIARFTRKLRYRYKCNGRYFSVLYGGGRNKSQSY